MAAERSRCQLGVPKELLSLLGSFSGNDFSEPKWFFSRTASGCSVKIVWKSISTTSPNGARPVTARTLRNRRRMEAFVAKKNAQHSAGGGHDVASHPHKLCASVQCPQDISEDAERAQSDHAPVTDGYPQTASLLCSLPEIENLPAAVLSSSESVASESSDVIAPLSPIASRTRKQCTVRKEVCLNELENINGQRKSCNASPAAVALPGLVVPDSLYANVTKYHVDYYRCEDEDSAAAVKSSMEQQWGSAVKPGQMVRVRRKDDFVPAVVERVLFLSKLASNFAYFYATAKVILRLPDCSSSSEFQFRDLT